MFSENPRVNNLFKKKETDRKMVEACRKEIVVHKVKPDFENCYKQNREGGRKFLEISKKPQEGVHLSKIKNEKLGGNFEFSKEKLRYPDALPVI